MPRKKKMVMNLKATMLSSDNKRKGQPWRSIIIENSRSLSELADIIMSSFDFKNDHDYGFYSNINSYQKSETGYESIGDTKRKDIFPGVKESILSSVFTEEGEEMLFLFDYATQWKFIIKLSSLEPYDRKGKYPAIAKTNGEAPSQYNFDDDDFDLA